MSGQSNDIGCLGYVFIAFAVLMLLGGLGGLSALGGGGDTSSWDCPGEPTPCEQQK